MDAILKYLTWIYDNYPTIITIVAVVVGIYFKIKKTITDWQAKSEAEKEAALATAQRRAIEEAKYALSEIVLKLVSDAEVAWRSEGGGLGKIKRSEVISTCFEKYPILLTVADKQEVIDYIDELIEKALQIVREKIRTD